jgi:hypothetical protein
MKNRIAIAAAATLVLAGCGGVTESAGQASDEPASPTTSTAPAMSTPAAAPAKGDKPTKEFVVGKWGTDGDCVLAMDLRADGTSDGPFGNWSYSDGVISFAEAPELKVNVTVIDDQTMESHNTDSGKSTKMTRCP